MAALTLDIAEELIERIARRAAELLAERQTAPVEEGYLDVAGAAEFLACPKSRIYSLVSIGRIPHHRDGPLFSSIEASCASTCEKVGRGDRDGLRRSGVRRSQVDDIARMLSCQFKDLGVSGPERSVKLEGGGDAKGIGVREATHRLDGGRRHHQRPIRVDDGEAPADRVDIGLG